MGFADKLVRKALPQFDRRLDFRVDRKLEERVLPELPRQSKALDDLARTSEELVAATDAFRFEVGEKLAELRRWVIDDMEAANEATVLVGESLSRLQASVDRLSEELSGVAGRLAKIEATLAPG